MTRKIVRSNGYQFIECLAHHPEGLHVHVLDQRGQPLGVWNVAYQRGERGLVLTNSLRRALASARLMSDPTAAVRVGQTNG